MKRHLVVIDSRSTYEFRDSNFVYLLLSGSGLDRGRLSIWAAGSWKNMHTLGVF